MNACKSGIYSQSEIIPGEDPDQLAELTAEYYDSIQPQSRQEAVLVDQLISADWQLRRLRHSEAGIFTKFMDKPGRTASGWAYMNNSATLDRLYRNQAAISRNLRASLDTLLRLRKLDLLQPDLDQSDETNPIPGGAGASAPPPGFCPAQSDPEPKPSEPDETNPIAEPPAPIPDQSDETKPIPEVQPDAEKAEGPTTDSQTLIPDPRLAPAPAPGARFRYYNGHRVPITEIPKS
jgi:hypothetical protein